MAVDGTYNIEMNTQRGTRTGTLTLKANGGLLSGSYTAERGTQSFENGTVEGNNVSWSMKLAGPMGEIQLDFSGKVAGDEISGEVKLGAFGSAPFKGRRTA